MLRLPTFEVAHPATIEEAAALLARPGARAIAGGTDLLPHLKHRLEAPALLVSLARLGLDQITELPEEIRIGANVRLSDVARLTRLPSLARAASLVATPGIRELATLGGNLHAAPRCRYVDQTAEWRAAIGGCLRSGGDRCHVVERGRQCVAALSADTVPALVSLDATITLVSPRGARTLALADYYRADGADHVARAPDELLTEVRVPAPPGRLAAYTKWSVRGAFDFPLVSLALRFDVDAGIVRGAAIVAGALAAAPRRLAVDDLLGRPLDADRVAERVAAQCRPLANLPYDADYRRAMYPVHARRAVTTLLRAP